MKKTYGSIKFMSSPLGSEIISSHGVSNIAHAMPDKFKMSDMVQRFARAGVVNHHRAADRLLQRMRRAGEIEYQSKGKVWVRVGKSQGRG